MYIPRSGRCLVLVPLAPLALRSAPLVVGRVLHPDGQRGGHDDAGHVLKTGSGRWILKGGKGVGNGVATFSLVEGADPVQANLGL